MIQMMLGREAAEAGESTNSPKPKANNKRVIEYSGGRVLEPWGSW